MSKKHRKKNKVRARFDQILREDIGPGSTAAAGLAVAASAEILPQTIDRNVVKRDIKRIGTVLLIVLVILSGLKVLTLKSDLLDRLGDQLYKLLNIG